MGPRLIVFILAAVCIISQANCKSFSRCALAKELKRHGFSRFQLRNWVCLVESESGRRTNAVGARNKNGSRDFGLFQINDKYWCSASNKPGKDCNVKCKDLLSNNISKAANCAKKIYARHGFNAWYGWINKCKGKALPNLNHCGV